MRYDCSLCDAKGIHHLWFKDHLIEEHGLTSEQYALHQRGLDKPPVCQHCHGPVPFLGITEGWREFCGHDCKVAAQRLPERELERRRAKLTRKRDTCAECGHEVYAQKMTQHLKTKHDMMPEQYYRKHVMGLSPDDKTVPTCETPGCTNPVEFEKLSTGYYRHCSKSCSVTHLHMDPAYQERHAAQSRKNAQVTNSNPDNIAASRERITALNQDPEFQKKRDAVSGARFKKYWQDNPDFIEKASANGLINGRANSWGKHKGYHISLKAGEVYYRSGWELVAFKMLDADDEVKTYQVEAVTIPYRLHGKTRRYTPDILVTYQDGTREMLEIKPSTFTETEENQAKFAAAEKYCAKHGIQFTLLTEEELGL